MIMYNLSVFHVLLIITYMYLICVLLLYYVQLLKNVRKAINCIFLASLKELFLEGLLSSEIRSHSNY